MSDLGVELYKMFGLEGLRGHPAFDPLIEEDRKRKAKGPRWHRPDDCGHYKSVTAKLDTTSPVEIIVICPSHPYMMRFRSCLLEDYQWDRVLQDTLQKNQTRIFFISEPYRETRGLRVDYLAAHRDVSWRTFEAIRPCADSVIRY